MKRFQLLILTSAVVASAACKTSARSKIESAEDISSMQRDGNYYHIACTDGSEQEIAIDKFRDTNPDDICPNAGGGPVASSPIRLFADGACNQVVGTVSSQSQCNVASNQNVGSIQSSAGCESLPQSLPYARACEAFRAGGSGMALYSTSSCSGNSVVAFVNAASQCDKVGQNAPNYDVTAVKTATACIGLPQQLKVAMACEAFKGFRRGGRELYASNGCSDNSLIASVGVDTDCVKVQQNAPNYNVVAVKTDGQCLGIPQPIGSGQGCEIAKTPGDAQIYSSSDCNSTSLLAMVGPRSDCAKIGAAAPNYDATAVKINGVCAALPQQVKVLAACQVFKADVTVASLFSNSSCQGGSLLAIVDQNSDCAAIQAQASNYSVVGVSINGDCRAFPQGIKVGAACESARRASGNFVEFYSGTNCTSGGFLAAASHASDCALLGSSAPHYDVASIRVAGQCQALAQQLKVDAACEQFKDQ